LGVASFARALTIVECMGPRAQAPAGPLLDEVRDTLRVWRRPSENAGAASPDALLARLGYGEPAEVRRWVEQAGSPLGPALRQTLDELLPALVLSAARCREPDATLRGSLDLLLRLVGRSEAARALAQHPFAVQRIVALVGASPWLGQSLLGHPEPLDELLPDRYRPRLPGAGELRAELAAALEPARGVPAEELLAMRLFKQRRLVHILALDLDGAIDLDEVSGALSDVAELLLDTVLRRASEQLRLGAVPPMALIGYGKLGSREMSYASDTDVVFVYDPGRGVPEAELSRLARTVNQWITAPTAAGVLYQTDFRLRPYGESGLLVSSFGAFRDYQTDHARVWEHQALTRARWVAGDQTLAPAVAELRAAILGQRRDPDHLRAAVAGMRGRIFAAHGRAAGGAFDVKHSRGGIIDVEFLVQHTVLRHGADHRELVETGDNVGVLTAAARLGLLPADLAGQAAAAYRQYRLWMHAERLRGTEAVSVPMSLAAPHRAAVLALWEQILGDLTG
jgi:glutamate-ammonia-ligase adenylyltransferase